MMSIDSNIKTIKERFGLAQSQLGEIAGVTDKAVSTWENGTAEPRLGAIQKISDALNIKKSEIIDGYDACTFTVKEQQLLSSFRQLNDEGQNKVIAYADDLSSSGRYIKSNFSELVEEA